MAGSYRLGIIIGVAFLLFSEGPASTRGFCGDGFCSYDELESCSTCPEDCCCGDSFCSEEESCLICDEDCGECPPTEPPYGYTVLCTVEYTSSCSKEAVCTDPDFNWIEDWCGGSWSCDSSRPACPPAECKKWTAAPEPFWICD